MMFNDYPLMNSNSHKNDTRHTLVVVVERKETRFYLVVLQVLLLALANKQFPIPELNEFPSMSFLGQKELI